MSAEVVGNSQQSWGNIVKHAFEFDRKRRPGTCSQPRARLVFVASRTPQKAAERGRLRVHAARAVRVGSRAGAPPPVTIRDLCIRLSVFGTAILLAPVATLHEVGHAMPADWTATWLDFLATRISDFRLNSCLSPLGTSFVTLVGCKDCSKPWFDLTA